MRALTALVGSVLLLAPGLAWAAGVDDLWNRTPEELQRGIESAHPATYYVLARRLFEEGRRDEAVFWFYLGQLRYRVHLTARPKLDPTGDPALFSSLSEVVGRPLNEYAFGDLPRLVKTIDEVLAWDAAHPDGFTPRDGLGAVPAGVRQGLEKLKDYVTQNGAQIRRQREAAGLPNRN
jgi:hypothetical protein